jgi:hypothetical protein
MLHGCSVIPITWVVTLAADRAKGRLWLSLVVAVTLLSGMGYYLAFIHDSGSNAAQAVETTVQKTPTEVAEVKQFYAATKARLRDSAAAENSNVIGLLRRGEPVSGAIVAGTAEGQLWLKLADDKGFVNIVNLSENPAPVLKTSFGGKVFTLPQRAILLSAPSQNSPILDRLAQGLALTTSGITRNGYAEIIRKTGGVGYIANGEQLLAALEKPALARAMTIKIDNNGCAAGPEIDSLFRQIQFRQAAGLKAVEDAKYPDDDARDAAIAKYRQRTEGKSVIIPLERSFRTLTVTGLAQHYESQSVYFADPPEQVRKVFRSIGYRVGKDGKLPSGEIYAGIDPAPKGNASYGKTDLGCGV